jgi:hypothetical protein
LAVALLGGALPAADPVPVVVPPVPSPAIVAPPLPVVPDSPQPLPVRPPERTVTAYQLPPTPPSVAPAEPLTQPPREAPLEPYLPPLPFEPEVVLPDGARINLPASAKQVIRFTPRYAVPNNAKKEYLDEAKTVQRILYTGGVIVNVVYLNGTGPAATQQEIEFATDNAVIWIKGAKSQQQLGAEINVGAGGNDKSEVEVYMTGNVVIRTLHTDARGGKTVEQVMRAKEIYYDVSRSRAIALCADLALRVTGLPEVVHLRGREVWQLGKNEWKIFETDASSSKRPSDPALRFTSRDSTLVQRKGVRRNVFGIPYRNVVTGEPDLGYERILTSNSVKLRVFDTPIMYFPRTVTDVNEPMGPLAGIGFGNNRIFGTQFYSTWDIYKLLALRHPDGHRWVLYADYLSLRGPAFGTEYDYQGQDMFGFAPNAQTRDPGRPALAQPYTGFFKIYGIWDKGRDILGGDRRDSSNDPMDPPHPYHRYRIQWRNNQDLYEDGLTYVRALAQVEYFTDRNFFEQYYKQEFDFGPNQETFGYLYGASGNAWGSLWYEQNLHRRWITETEWKPRADGALIGQSFLNDRLVYSSRASVGQASLLPASITPAPVAITDRPVNTTRLDWMQRVDAPFDLGPVRLAPYGIVDLSYYSNTISGYNGGIGPRAAAGVPLFDYAPPPSGADLSALPGGGRGRFYGGGGVQASTTFSRLYPQAASELFNVRGLNHKVTYGLNYYNAYSDTPYYMLPQLDRLNDDSTDFSYRLSRPRDQYVVAGPGGYMLSHSPVFDPQQLAIRRLVMNRPDTLDSINVLELNSQQRLQTMRGFPGAEHIVDWLSLDLSMSLFPQSQRDNYGQSWAFGQYRFLWNVGDRTAISSAGWIDPFDFGTRYYNFGINFNRPDGTAFYLGYRHTDPLDSRAMTASISYKLSRKYSVNLIGTYDFGVNTTLSTTASFARTGTDTTILLGFSYNALVNNFGLQFAILPNVAGLSASRYTVRPYGGAR